MAVQDYDPIRSKRINKRRNSFCMIFVVKLANAAREIRFWSITIDFSFGMAIFKLGSAWRLTISVTIAFKT